jgi:serine/threonine-protein kinase
VHDVFEHDHRQAVVMQLVDGKSLRQLLDSQKRLSPKLTCHIGACVAAALDHAHRAGFVHRDVKPGNIMITPDGRVLLTDFGIAKGLGTGELDLTDDNIMMGTAKYLSPEQVRGKKLDGRADLYSLGLVLYECLAGRVPFLGETDADTALARLQRDPTDLSRLRATLPLGLVNVTHQLLARNPAHRPATGAELEARLREAAEEESPPFDPTGDEPSPVVPFPAGPLRRAPSDYRGRSIDHRRARRGSEPDQDDTAPSGPSGLPPPSVPSEPTGAPGPPGPPAPSGRSGSADDSPTHGAEVTPPSIPGEAGALAGAPGARRNSDDTPPARREPTPAAGVPLRGQPARGLTDRRLRPTVVVASLVAVGALVGLTLWLTLAYVDDEPVTSTTVLPAGAGAGGAGGAGAGNAATTVAPAAPAAIASAVAYDPDGDGTENDELAADALADGDPSTAWSTVCYSSQYLGAKRGVGLLLTLDGPAQQAVSVDVLNAPYQLRFFASDAERPPPSIDGWGAELGTSNYGTEPATVVSEVPDRPVRHVLVLLSELGPDTGCTAANPYRGSLGEITLVR